MRKAIAIRLAAIPAFSLATGYVFAAVDPAVSGAISTAQTDALSVAGLLTAMVAVVWGALFIKRKFFG